MPRENNIHADILANLLYVTVGFSLVVVLFSSLKEIRDINSLWQAILSFAFLILPSVVFIAYIKTHKHESWLVALDYLFLFFVSAYAFSLTPEGRLVQISILNQTISLTNLSLVLMLGYPLTLQICWLRSVFQKRTRNIFYTVLVKPHEGSELKDIQMVFWLLSGIGFFAYSLALIVVTLWIGIGFAIFSTPDGLLPIPESTLRTSVVCIWMILMPVCLTFFYYARLDTLAVFFLVASIFLVSVFNRLFFMKEHQRS